MKDLMQPIYYHDPEDSDWDAILVTRQTISEPCECCGVGEYVYEYLPESEWYWAPMRRIVVMDELLKLEDEPLALFATLANLGKPASDAS